MFRKVAIAVKNCPVFVLGTVAMYRVVFGVKTSGGKISW
jgi:hypothetical protein